MPLAGFSRTGGSRREALLRRRVSADVLRCPFCGSEETDRLDLGGERFVVFACAFTPRVDPDLPDDRLQAELDRTYPAEQRHAYFRGVCDRLHLFVLREGRAEAASATR
jgi:hypothetical protein